MNGPPRSPSASSNNRPCPRRERNGRAVPPGLGGGGDGGSVGSGSSRGSQKTRWGAAHPASDRRPKPWAGARPAPDRPGNHHRFRHYPRDPPGSRHAGDPKSFRGKSAGGPRALSMLREVSRSEWNSSTNGDDDGGNSFDAGNRGGGVRKTPGGERTPPSSSSSASASTSSAENSRPPNGRPRSSRPSLSPSPSAARKRKRASADDGGAECRRRGADGGGWSGEREGGRRRPSGPERPRRDDDRGRVAAAVASSSSASLSPPSSGGHRRGGDDDARGGDSPPDGLGGRRLGTGGGSPRGGVCPPRTDASPGGGGGIGRGGDRAGGGDPRGDSIRAWGPRRSGGRSFGSPSARPSPGDDRRGGGRRGADDARRRRGGPPGSVSTEGRAPPLLGAGPEGGSCRRSDAGPAPPRGRDDDAAAAAGVGPGGGGGGRDDPDIVAGGSVASSSSSCFSSSPYAVDRTSGRSGGAGMEARGAPPSPPPRGAAAAAAAGEGRSGSGGGSNGSGSDPAARGGGGREVVELLESSSSSDEDEDEGGGGGGSEAPTTTTTNSSRGAVEDRDGGGRGAAARGGGEEDVVELLDSSSDEGSSSSSSSSSDDYDDDVVVVEEARRQQRVGEGRNDRGREGTVGDNDDDDDARERRPNGAGDDERRRSGTGGGDRSDGAARPVRGSPLVLGGRAGRERQAGAVDGADRPRRGGDRGRRGDGDRDDDDDGVVVDDGRGWGRNPRAFYGGYVPTAASTASAWGSRRPDDVAAAGGRKDRGGNNGGPRPGHERRRQSGWGSKVAESERESSHGEHPLPPSGGLSIVAEEAAPPSGNDDAPSPSSVRERNGAPPGAWQSNQRAGRRRTGKNNGAGDSDGGGIAAERGGGGGTGESGSDEGGVGDARDGREARWTGRRRDGVSAAEGGIARAAPSGCVDLTIDDDSSVDTIAREGTSSGAAQAAQERDECGETSRSVASASKASAIRDSGVCAERGERTDDEAENTESGAHRQTDEGVGRPRTAGADADRMDRGGSKFNRNRNSQSAADGSLPTSAADPPRLALGSKQCANTEPSFVSRSAEVRNDENSGRLDPQCRGAAAPSVDCANAISAKRRRVSNGGGEEAAARGPRASRGSSSGGSDTCSGNIPDSRREPGEARKGAGGGGRGGRAGDDGGPSAETTTNGPSVGLPDGVEAGGRSEEEAVKVDDEESGPLADLSAAKRISGVGGAIAEGRGDPAADAVGPMTDEDADGRVDGILDREDGSAECGGATSVSEVGGDGSERSAAVGERGESDPTNHDSAVSVSWGDSGQPTDRDEARLHNSSADVGEGTSSDGTRAAQERDEFDGTSHSVVNASKASAVGEGEGCSERGGQREIEVENVDSGEPKQTDERWCRKAGAGRPRTAGADADRSHRPQMDGPMDRGGRPVLNSKDMNKPRRDRYSQSAADDSLPTPAADPPGSMLGSKRVADAEASSAGQSAEGRNDDDSGRSAEAPDPQCRGAAAPSAEGARSGPTERRRVGDGGGEGGAARPRMSRGSSSGSDECSGKVPDLHQELGETRKGASSGRKGRGNSSNCADFTNEYSSCEAPTNGTSSGPDEVESGGQSEADVDEESGPTHLSIARKASGVRDDVVEGRGDPIADAVRLITNKSTDGSCGQVGRTLDREDRSTKCGSVASRSKAERGESDPTNHESADSAASGDSGRPADGDEVHLSESESASSSSDGSSLGSFSLDFDDDDDEMVEDRERVGRPSDGYDSSDDELSCTLRQNTSIPRHAPPCGDIEKCASRDAKEGLADSSNQGDYDQQSTKERPIPVSGDQPTPAENGVADSSFNLAYLDANICLSDVFDANALQLLYASGIERPSHLVHCDTSILPHETANLANRFRKWCNKGGVNFIRGIARRKCNAKGTKGHKATASSAGRRQEKRKFAAAKTPRSRLRGTGLCKFPSARGKVEKRDSVAERSRSKQKRRRVSCDDLATMNEVSHYSRTTLEGPSGMPVKHFTVFNAHDETLYDFSIAVSESAIPDSGRGAHLTFRGGRSLRPDSGRISAEALGSLVPHVEETMRPLRAQTPDGLGVAVSLAGEHLHENGGRLYVAPTRCPLVATLPLPNNGGKEVRVRLRGVGVHGEAEDLMMERSVPERSGGIGFLGLHSESDYVDDDSVTFCSYFDGCGLVDLGRYGPLQKTDRKTEHEFILKDFIFDYEPGAWNFDVEENIRGYKQIIDVTDDRTGEPHRGARQGVLMYVNEVGHNKQLKQNVLAREDHGRVVHYFLHLDEPIKKGESVELLVDYLGPYEPIRERKGYGKANIEHGVNGDECERSRIYRNIKERSLLEKEISQMPQEELAETLKFIQLRILRPVVSWTNWYIDKIKLSAKKKIVALPEQNAPHPRQWLARRRIYWLRQIFQKRANVIATTNDESLREVTKEINNILEEMKCNFTAENVTNLQQVQTHRRENFACTLLGELREELLHLASKDLQCPYMTSTWCPVASKVFNQAISLMAASMLCRDPKHIWQEKLMEGLLKAASDSATTVRRCCEGTKLGMYEDLRMLLFQPSRLGSVSCTEPFIVGYDNSNGAGCGREFLVVGEDVAHESGTPPFLSVISLIQKQDRSALVALCQNQLSGTEQHQISVDENWYLLWQVVFVVHSLATNCVQWERQGCARPNDRSVYSLSALCHVVGLNLEDVEKAFKCTEKYAPMAVLNVAKTVQVEPESGAKRPTTKQRNYFYDTIWKCLEMEGWRIELGGRNTDLYFCPPGVSRWAPFKHRRDYFDSIPQVINTVETNNKWKGIKTVKEAVQAYHKLMREGSEM